LESLEFTKEGLKQLNSKEELVEKCMMLVDTDIRVFYSFLEKQGYDLWLQKVSHITAS